MTSLGAQSCKISTPLFDWSAIPLSKQFAKFEKSILIQLVIAFIAPKIVLDRNSEPNGRLHHCIIQLVRKCTLISGSQKKYLPFLEVVVLRISKYYWNWSAAFYFERMYFKIHHIRLIINDDFNWCWCKNKLKNRMLFNWWFHHYFPKVLAEERCICTSTKNICIDKYFYRPKLFPFVRKSIAI